MRKIIYLVLLLICSQTEIYAQNKVTVVEPESSVKQIGKSLKRKVAISRFSNETQ